MSTKRREKMLKERSRRRAAKYERYQRAEKDAQGLAPSDCRLRKAARLRGEPMAARPMKVAVVSVASKPGADFEAWLRSTWATRVRLAA
ncbi:MAG: hypothetical protein QM723_07060 [Myxococcaceae bacterium]